MSLNGKVDTVAVNAIINHMLGKKVGVKCPPHLNNYGFFGADRLQNGQPKKANIYSKLSQLTKIICNETHLQCNRSV